MESTSLLIEHVLSGPAKVAGVRKGDRILRVNGHRIHDELDYRFFGSGEWNEVDVERPETGEQWRKRLPGLRNSGLVFAPWRPMECANHCIFCFVDQLPKGLRSSLYVKDEDYRLSFLHGNFLTLSAVPDRVLERICTMRLSPLYVSVHATDPHIRAMMLGRKHSRDISHIVRTLTEAKITMHAQVVLCPGINDGDCLDKTIEDLLGFYPRVSSLAVVPVGLTRYRKENRLYPLEPVTREYALKIVNKIRIIQKKCKAKYDDYFVFLSDEFYIKANRRFPPHAVYGDFPQLENGVGMIPRFLSSWMPSKHAIPKRPLRGRAVVVVTGTHAYPFVAHYIRQRIEPSGVNVHLLAIPNRFFGARVTVTGLLTARDLMESLRGVIRPGNVLLIPDVMLKSDEDVFLDGVSLAELSEELHVDVEKFAPCPEEFEKILYKAALRV